MFTSTNMGLTVWDLGADPYNHSQLAANWNAVDLHDHTTGKGKQVPTGGIVDSAVTAVKIATGAVTPTKILNDSLTSAQLATDAVGTVEIQDASVTTAKLVDGSVTSAKLAADIFNVGDVKMWYRSSGSIGLPAGGWEVMDGRAWSTITNKMGIGGAQLNTGNIPDMANKFPLGAGFTNLGTGATNNPDIGQAGTTTHTTSLAHTHTVNAHTHTISSDGLHGHYFGADAGTITPPAAPSGVGPEESTANRGNDNYATGTPVAEAFAYKNHTHYGTTGSNGTHTHGGVTGSVSPGTDSQLSATHDKRPAYVGLLFLMKVR